MKHKSDYSASVLEDEFLLKAAYNLETIRKLLRKYRIAG